MDIEELYAIICRRSKRIVRSHYVREELIQNAFLKYLGKLKEGVVIDKPIPYLLASIRNGMKDYLKHQDIPFKYERNYFRYSHYDHEFTDLDYDTYHPIIQGIIQGKDIKENMSDLGYTSVAAYHMKLGREREKLRAKFIDFS